ncbi:MAG: patatin-like phospholipase family protein [Clostridiales bacterium]|nr:patatin-like phospholipase family protein [Clostridiales bacterium]
MKKVALVLSGGGSRGGYQIGVWEALRELDIKPDMVFGTSVGAINSAMIAQGNLELSKNLWLQMETDMIFDIDDAKEEIPENVKEKISDLNIAGMPAENAIAYAKEIVLSGGAGNTGLLGLLNKYVDEKKVRASGLIYGLVATAFPGFSGRFLSLNDIPQGCLVNYIIASASCFPAVQKCTIDGTTYIDGGYSDNMPVSMALNNGATDIIAVNLEAAGFIRKDTIKRAEKEAHDFRIIKSPHDLGNFLLFDKKNTERIMRLGYLDAMRAFGKYDGSVFTFEKGCFSSHGLMGADMAANILELDPTRIYNRKTLLAALDDSIASYRGSSRYGIYALNTSLKIKEIVTQISHDLSDGELRISILCYIADSLKKDQANSIFLKPSLFKLLEHDVQAANFLLQNGLL